jgi:hypothetical protein
VDAGGETGRKLLGVTVRNSSVADRLPDEAIGILVSGCRRQVSLVSLAEESLAEEK